LTRRSASGDGTSRQSRPSRRGPAARLFGWALKPLTRTTSSTSPVWKPPAASGRAGRGHSSTTTSRTQWKTGGPPGSPPALPPTMPPGSYKLVHNVYEPTRNVIEPHQRQGSSRVRASTRARSVERPTHSLGRRRDHPQPHRSGPALQVRAREHPILATEPAGEAQRRQSLPLCVLGGDGIPPRIPAQFGLFDAGETPCGDHHRSHIGLSHHRVAPRGHAAGALRARLTARSAGGNVLVREGPPPLAAGRSVAPDGRTAARQGSRIRPGGGRGPHAVIEARHAEPGNARLGGTSSCSATTSRITRSSPASR